MNTRLMYRTKSASNSAKPPPIRTISRIQSVANLISVLQRRPGSYCVEEWEIFILSAQYIAVFSYICICENVIRAKKAGRKAKHVAVSLRNWETILQSILSKQRSCGTSWLFSWEGQPMADSKYIFNAHMSYGGAAQRAAELITGVFLKLRQH